MTRAENYGHGVASNLACVGLAVADVDELQSLVSRAGTGRVV